jgi:hypothetical protein
MFIKTSPIRHQSEGFSLTEKPTPVAIAPEAIATATMLEREYGEVIGGGTKSDICKKYESRRWYQFYVRLDDKNWHRIAVNEVALIKSVEEEDAITRGAMAYREIEKAREKHARLIRKIEKGKSMDAERYFGRQQSVKKAFEAEVEKINARFA